MVLIDKVIGIKVRKLIGKIIIVFSLFVFLFLSFFYFQHSDYEKLLLEGHKTIGHVESVEHDLNRSVNGENPQKIYFTFFDIMNEKVKKGSYSSFSLVDKKKEVTVFYIGDDVVIENVIPVKSPFLLFLFVTGMCFILGLIFLFMKSS